MVTVVTRAIGFVLVIALGYVMKKRGVIRREDASIFSSLVMNVTLPCAILASTQALVWEGYLILPLFLGLLANLILDAVGYWEAKKSGRRAAVGLMQLSGYNIGTFTLPFVQAFFPPAALVSVLLFDAGNALMVLGGNYSLAASLDKKEKGLSLRGFAQNLCRSIPFLVYLIAVLLAAFQVGLPKEITALVSIAGNANPFLAMLMLGILLDLDVDSRELLRLFKLLTLRLGTNLLLGFAFYLFLPLPELVRQLLLVCLASPISVVAPVYALKLGSNSSEPANLNSLSILVSLLLMMLLLFFFA